MFWFGLFTGTLGAGALMYYVQPTIKRAVALAFGYEAQLADHYAELAKDIRALKPAQPGA